MCSIGVGYRCDYAFRDNSCVETIGLIYIKKARLNIIIFAPREGIFSPKNFFGNFKFFREKQLTRGNFWLYLIYHRDRERTSCSML